MERKPITHKDWAEFVIGAAISEICEKERISASGSALMLEAMDRALTYPDLADGLEQEFTRPYSDKLIRAARKQGL